MTEQLGETPQIDQESADARRAAVAPYAGEVPLQRLAKNVRDEAIDGIPIVRDLAHTVRGLMQSDDGRRHFTSPKR